MKKLMLTALLGCIFSMANAQTKAVITTRFQTPTVQCGMCKERIETYLKRIDGVLSVNVNYRKKETTVKFLSDRTNEVFIRTMIANAGYDADDVKANEDSYKLLPKCCKKPEDGGGMKKN